MNDPEVTMLDALPNSNLTVYRKAIEAAAIAIDLVRRVPSPLTGFASRPTLERGAPCGTTNLHLHVGRFTDGWV